MLGLDQQRTELNVSESVSIETLKADTLHLVPDDLEGAEGIEDELEATLPITPTIDTKQRDLEEREVQYYTEARGPADVMLSGPVIGGWGPGRYFQNRRRAYAYLVEKYGKDRVKDAAGPVRGRWAFLVKGLKNAS